MKWVRTFGKVPPGADLAYLDSRTGLGSGHFSLGVKRGNLRQKYRLGPGDFIRISKAREFRDLVLILLGPSTWLQEARLSFRRIS